MCWHSGRRSANPEDDRSGCNLTEECGAICLRDPEFAGNGTTLYGHRAGFDFLDTTWCGDARPMLPKGEIRDFWFPPLWDRRAWRAQRYQRRQQGRQRDARRGDR